MPIFALTYKIWAVILRFGTVVLRIDRLKFISTFIAHSYAAHSGSRVCSLSRTTCVEIVCDIVKRAYAFLQD